MITLETDLARVRINPQGSELVSFFDKAESLEYVWQAGEIWPKSAPILFPIVGALKDERYTFRGKEYSLPRHGFTREQVFEVKQVSDSEAVFSLRSSAGLKKVYPFDFELEIRWTLKGKTLHAEHRVSNTGAEELLYSFGLHPAFTLCFAPNQGVETLSLVLDHDENWLSTAGLNPDSTHYPSTKDFGRNPLALTPTIFDEDVMIFENLKSRGLVLQSSAHRRRLVTKWSGNLNILGIWSKPKAPFVCIEPWAGICDAQGSDGTLEHKKGIRRLKKGGSEVFTFTAAIEA